MCQGLNCGRRLWKLALAGEKPPGGPTAEWEGQWQLCLYHGLRCCSGRNCLAPTSFLLRLVQGQPKGVLTEKEGEPRECFGGKDELLSDDIPTMAPLHSLFWQTVIRGPGEKKLYLGGKIEDKKGQKLVGPQCPLHPKGHF